MNVKQAAILWEVSERMARKVCKQMNLDPKKIPEDTIPIYIPDKRYTKDPHRFYVFVLDVIINGHLELVGIDPGIITTCVEQLSKAGIIVLKHGRSADSLEYRDYMISANIVEFYNWKNAKMKSKIDMITPILSAVSEGVTATGTLLAAVVVH